MRIALSGLWPPGYRGKYKKWKKILIGLSEAEALKKKERLLAVYIFSQIFTLAHFLTFLPRQLLACYPELESTAWILSEDDLLNLYSTS